MCLLKLSSFFRVFAEAHQLPFLCLLRLTSYFRVFAEAQQLLHHGVLLGLQEVPHLSFAYLLHSHCQVIKISQQWPMRQPFSTSLARFTSSVMFSVSSLGDL